MSVNPEAQFLVEMTPLLLPALFFSCCSIPVSPQEQLPQSVAETSI